MINRLTHAVAGLLVGIVCLIALLAIVIQGNIFGDIDALTEEPQIGTESDDEFHPPESPIFSTYHVNEFELSKYEKAGVIRRGKTNPMSYITIKPETKEPETKEPIESSGVNDDVKTNDTDIGSGSGSASITKKPVELTRKDYSMGYNKESNLIDFKKTDDIDIAIKDQGILPVDASKYTITSPFGVRLDPFTKTKAFHTGIDIAHDVDGGNNIYSILAGTVEAMDSDDEGLGNHVIINHGKFKTIYGHMSEYAENLTLGASVNAGDTIGYVGTSGRSTGPHLHLELEYENISVDPEPFMKMILEK